MSERKFCKDCKWAKVAWQDRFFRLGKRFAKCYRPTNQWKSDTSLVTGERKVEYTFCSVERLGYAGAIANHCGPDGQYFEAKDE